MHDLNKSNVFPGKTNHLKRNTHANGVYIYIYLAAAQGATVRITSALVSYSEW